MSKTRLLGIIIFFGSLWIGSYIVSNTRGFFPGFPVTITSIIAVFIGVYMIIDEKFPGER